MLLRLFTYVVLTVNLSWATDLVNPVVDEQKAIQLYRAIVDFRYDSKNSEKESCFKQIKQLIDKGAKLEGSRIAGDASALHLACGARINPRDPYRQEEDCLPIVELLLSKDVDVNICVHNDYTPLHRACQNGFVGIAELLIKFGASESIKKNAEMYNRNINFSIDNRWDSYTPLHLALTNDNCNISIVNYFINYSRENVNEAEEYNWQLMWAVKSKYKQTPLQLVEANFNTFTITREISYETAKAEYEKIKNECYHDSKKCKCLQFLENTLRPIFYKTVIKMMAAQSMHEYTKTQGPLPVT